MEKKTKEILNALYCCSTIGTICDKNKCYLNDYDGDCVVKLMKDSGDLIQDQNKQIEGLQSQVADMAKAIQYNGKTISAEIERLKQENQKLRDKIDVDKFQKPLSVFEAQSYSDTYGDLYIELRGEKKLRYGRLHISLESYNNIIKTTIVLTEMIDRHSGKISRLPISHYNESIRCWAKEPTIEERDMAKWNC